MKPLIKFRFIVAIALSFFFFIFDCYVGTSIVVFHLGPMIVAILFVSVILDLQKK